MSSTSAPDRVDARRYLHILRDPVSRGALELVEGEAGEPLLHCPTSGFFYRYRGAFPDLRPDAGLTSDPRLPKPALGYFDRGTAATHATVRDHFDELPCNNYMDLNNDPLGKYLRDRRYAYLFDGVELAVEVGSGKGAIATELKRYRAITPFCIDLAYGSIRHVRTAPLEADGALGSNLALPLADGVADVVVSYGVIHHTPDPILAFRELERVLKPGGRLLLGVYNWENLYRPMYSILSPPLRGLRHLVGERLGDAIIKATIFIPYHLAIWAVLAAVQRKFKFPDLRTSWEQFGDFFLTPIARFYYRNEMISVAEALGLRTLEYDVGGWPGGNFAHFYWFEKPAR